MGLQRVRHNWATFAFPFTTSQNQYLWFVLTKGMIPGLRLLKIYVKHSIEPADSIFISKSFNHMERKKNFNNYCNHKILPILNKSRYKACKKMKCSSTTHLFNFISILIPIVDYVHLFNLATRVNNEPNIISYKGDISLK